jgi:hypothetical protein
MSPPDDSTEPCRRRRDKDDSPVTTVQSDTIAEKDTAKSTPQMPWKSGWDLCKQLVDPSQPWLLVKNGSVMNFFDWVPLHYRVGPWSRLAVAFMASLYSAFCYWGTQVIPTYKPWLYQATHLVYPPVGSIQWYYNVLTLVWMLYVSYLVVTGPAGLKAWGTFTVQSWTLLMVRHGLVALAPLSRRALIAAEVTRFPVACSVTITFCVWNLGLMPFMVLTKRGQDRTTFLQFAFSFRLVQLHIFNLVFCILNVYTTSPSRRLVDLDGFFAMASSILYSLWYLLVLDRLGVHLYPIFSPRVRKLVVISWTSTLLLYYATFCAWRYILKPHTMQDNQPGLPPTTHEGYRETTDMSSTMSSMNNEPGVWLSKANLLSASQLWKMANQTLCLWYNNTVG